LRVAEHHFMAELWFHDFDFRGARPYIHSASICNYLQAHFGAITDLDITFKVWMAARVVFWTGGAEDGTSPDGRAAKGNFRCMTPDGREVAGFFADDPDHPTLTRLPYDEDGLVSTATVEAGLLDCPPGEAGSFTDRMIAANKLLINRMLNPGVKLIAARLKLDRFPPDDSAFRLRLDSHLGTRIFKSSLLSDGQKTGEIGYYGQ
jgi:hypothetical protein